jgi:GNAT superfamily N-acetyltransferase
MSDPPKGARLRIAQRDDVALVLRLIKELAAYEKLSHAVVATEDELRDALFGGQPAAEAMLAFVDDQPVGFALFYQSISTFRGARGLFLEDLYVRPEHRGQGIGTMLLSRFAQVARERNCGLLEWRALDWNEPALAFYRSLGAVPLDGWTVYRVTGDAMDRVADLATDA